MPGDLNERLQAAVSGAESAVTEPTGGSSAAASGAASAAAASQTASTGTTTTGNTQTPSTSGAASQGAGATGTPAGAAGQSQPGWSLRSTLAKQYGFKPEQFGSDEDAWGYVQNKIREASELAQYGRHYLTNREVFEKARAEGATQKQAETAAKTGEDWWKVPEWNSAHERFLTVDPQTGKVVAEDGADPGLVGKYRSYKQWQADTLDKLLRDPIGTLKPGLEKMISEMSEKSAESRVKQYQEREFAENYIRNQPWLYQNGADNRPVVDPMTGRPMLSQAGIAFVRNLQTVAQYIPDAQMQQRVAYEMTEAAALRDYIQRAMSNGGKLPDYAAPGGAQTPTGQAIEADAQLKAGAIQQPTNTAGATRRGNGGNNASEAEHQSGNRTGRRVSIRERLQKNLAGQEIVIP